MMSVSHESLKKYINIAISRSKESSKMCVKSTTKSKHCLCNKMPVYLIKMITQR